MKAQLKVSGMTCGHCVATVTNALTAVDGVSEARVDLPAGSAAVVFEGPSLSRLEQAVRDAGYGVGAAPQTQNLVQLGAPVAQGRIEDLDFTG